mgnify:CR=1 FL=1|jgi:hypothetical protein|nr:MAG TPA: Baseplate wedge protein [Caudoviricetes sp.]
MRPQTFQHPEIRDENDNIIKPGTFGKNSAFFNAENDGIGDYIFNDLEWLYEQVGADDITTGKLSVTGASTLSTVNADDITTGKLSVTGASTAPTAPAGNKSKIIANTEFVQNAISSLVSAAPETLDTLNELASALGNDPNFATTVSNKIGSNTTKINKNTQDIANIQKDIYTGAVNKKTLTSVGYVTPHKAIVTAEIIGYTADNLRRVKFDIIGVCVEKGTNSTEFKWLNFVTGDVGISSVYTDVHPQSEFVKIENDQVPINNCGCLTQEKRAYGAIATIVKEAISIGRVYTTNMDIGSYPNSELIVGGFSFSFIADFTNK